MVLTCKPHAAALLTGAHCAVTATVVLADSESQTIPSHHASPEVLLRCRLDQACYLYFASPHPKQKRTTSRTHTLSSREGCPDSAAAAGVKPHSLTACLHAKSACDSRVLLHSNVVTSRQRKHHKRAELSHRGSQLSVSMCLLDSRRVWDCLRQGRHSSGLGATSTCMPFTASHNKVTRVPKQGCGGGPMHVK
jgi:hypothetical protein